MDSDLVFAIINNIPKDYRSSDLRNYFSQFIESEGFECFHFRHRPEVQRQFGNQHRDDSATSQTENKPKNKTTQCCVVKMTASKYHQFAKMYNKHHWLDKRGDSIPALCHISKVKVMEDNPANKYMTRKEMKSIPRDRDSVTLQELMKLPELNPPINIMPNGNVGTKTQIFLDLIAKCKLPPNVIGKLGLVFPKRRSKRRYGCVSFDYTSSECHDGKEDSDNITSADEELEKDETCNNGECGKTDNSEDYEIESASGHSIIAENGFIKHGAKRKKTVPHTTDLEEQQIADESSGDDDDRCEEWERHEALHDDPSDFERNKERLFEEKIELKWEKGGSGLVFYTDAVYWRQQEGDFDEQTADDWDVDMSCYYEENGGDKDSLDLVTMRQERRRRDGEESTAMATDGFIGRGKRGGGGGGGGGKMGRDDIGQFEQHTKGIGRKVLEKHGWREGRGVGGSVVGMTTALDNEGQGPSDKRGIGYYGEKVVRFTAPKPVRQLRDFVISTVYDQPDETDPGEPLLRRNHHHHIKHRAQEAQTQGRETQTQGIEAQTPQGIKAQTQGIKAQTQGIKAQRMQSITFNS